MRTIRPALLFSLRHLPLVTLVTSIGVNVLLAHQLLRAQRSTGHRLEVGSLVKPFVAHSTSGAPLNVDYRGDRATVLYYFKPTCGWCERNWENVRSLVRGTRDRYRFVGLSTVPVSAAFMTDRQLNFDIAISTSDDVIRSYALGGTPQTFVIGQDGQVIKSWAGAYAGLLGREVERYFGLHLPGLQDMLTGTHSRDPGADVESTGVR